MIDLIISTLLVLPASIFLFFLSARAKRTGSLRLPGSGQVITRTEDARQFRFLRRILTGIGAVLLAGWVLQLFVVLT